MDFSSIVLAVIAAAFGALYFARRRVRMNNETWE